MLTYRDVLMDASGCRRSRQAAENLYGVRVVDVAEIFEALQSATNLPLRLSVPPRVFISYRWGSDEENARVYNLASLLREREGLSNMLKDREKPSRLKSNQRTSLSLGSCYIPTVLRSRGMKTSGA